jgi:4-amino-4-deoxy-L-arabinose transferase-like glycosyltransferase
MDADYYYATARQLADGEGFSQPFIWNYLDDPAGLPHASHTYWMPMTSIISACGLYLFGDTFRMAQFPQLLFAICLPLLAITLAKRFSADRKLLWSAGILSIFSGFYLPFFVTTDSFTLFAWIGSVAIIIAADTSQRPNAKGWFFVGFLTGLGFLTRADAILLFIPIAAAVRWSGQGRIKAILMLFIGFSLCSTPWIIRNLIDTGQAFSSGARRTLWLLSYNELFNFPADMLTAGRWWQAGLGNILSARLWSLGIILQRFVAEIGGILLWPFMIVGVYQLRKRREVQLATIYLVVLIGLMTIVYPFAGAYGGFFHSGTVLLPILWAVAPVGFDRTMEWAARKRNWNPVESKKVLGMGALVFMILISTALTWAKVIGVSLDAPRWQESQRIYKQIGKQLLDFGTGDDVVAVNNPPGFFLATGLNAVVIPNGSPISLKAVVDQYQARWVILDENHPEGLADLYEGDEIPIWLELRLNTQDSNGKDIQIWEVTPTEKEL